MNKKQPAGWLEKLSGFIVDRRTIIFLIFILLAAFCAFSCNWVKVNDSLTDYLDENTETRIGLDLMDREFTTFGSAKVMVQNISFLQAEELCEQVKAVEGVKSVDFDQTEDYYSSASALFLVTFEGTADDEVSIRALEQIRTLLSPYDLYLYSEVGNPLKAIIDKEMVIVDIIAVAIIILVLLLTSKTYAEIPILLITFGAAALLNLGTNYLMGEISFVTNSIAIVLQLALAIDYAIIFVHRYMEEHEQKNPHDAAVSALSKAIPEVFASSLTTISGLLALTFMKYRLGSDIGLVMIKAILLSLASVFFLMPGLLVSFSGAIDKTHHRNFVPKISFLGKFAYATRFVMPLLFIGVFVMALIYSNRANYVYSQYSVESIRQNEMQVAKKEIEDTFGQTNLLAVIVPSGDYDKEKKMIEEFEELPAVDRVVGLANIEAVDGYMLTDSLTPRQFAELADLDYEIARFLYSGYGVQHDDYGYIATNIDNYSIPLIDVFDYVLERRAEVAVELPEETAERLDELEVDIEDAKVQLKSDQWSRILLELDLPTEGPESFQYVEILHGVMARYYSEFYLVGDTSSCNDLKESFSRDNLLITVLSALFVIIVLIFTFKSAGLPVLLIMIIQGSIMVNFSTPYLEGKNLFFLTYLIINAIQMGANIDYAIVISSRYMKLKEQLPLREAMIDTLNQAFPTIITSGLMLASAGVVIGYVASNESISTIGIFLGQGTMISILLVMCVLPQILLLGDLLIRKTSFTLQTGLKPVQRSGLMRIDGRVRGNLNGYVDAEVHGIFRGNMNAVIDMSDLSDIDTVPLIESAETEEENHE